MAALEAVEPPIAHRDLKPSNVFLDGGGGARVADMNLSLRLHPESLACLTGETGTYLYMSPEMMRHEVGFLFRAVIVTCCPHSASAQQGLQYRFPGHVQPGVEEAK
jgi:serine/threonine protein kinase